MEHTAFQLLKRCGIGRANLIYIGGARFYILGPNTEKTQNAIHQIREQANTYLWKELGGKLALVLESQCFNGSDFKTERIAELWANLAEKLGEAKTRKYETHILDLLEPKEPVVPEGNCRACYRDDIPLKPVREEETEEMLCPFCEKLLVVGGMLPKAQFVYSTREKPLEEAPALPIYGEDETQPYFLVFSDRPLKSETCLYQLKTHDQILYQISELVTLSSGEYVRLASEIDPRGPRDQVATLKMLAEQSKGKKAIAALRMDVDRLGEIFRSGIPKEKRTFTRMAVLSRQLTQFFKDYLPLLLKGQVPSDFSLTDISGKNPEQNDRNVHVIYAGGDDLFLIGAWDEIAECAMDISNAFSRFSGGNPNVTLSGGFVLQKYDYPIYHLAELAHEAEQSAKNNGRNSLALFYSRELEKGQTHPPKGKKHIVSQGLKWDEVVPYVLQPLQELLPLVMPSSEKQERRLSRGDIQKFFQITERWERQGVLYLPHLAYMLARIKDFMKDYPTLCGQLMQPGYLPTIRNAVVWLDLLLREKNEKEG